MCCIDKKKQKYRDTFGIAVQKVSRHTRYQYREFFGIAIYRGIVSIAQHYHIVDVSYVLSAGHCTLPPVVNGSIVKPAGGFPGTKVKHGSILQYDCNEGFYPGTSATTCCHNGTWLTKPECSPGVCRKFFTTGD